MKKSSPPKDHFHHRSTSEQIHYPIESLGIVHATRGDIRAEELRKRLAPKIPFPHKHDFYQIVLIESGKGWHQIDFEKHLVSKAQCFVIHPGQVHAWELSPQSKGTVIEFTQESFVAGSLWEKNYQSQLRLLPTMLHLRHEAPSLFQIASEMQKEFSERKKGFEINLQSYLKIFLIHFLRAREERNVASREATSTVESFRRIVDENFHRHHDVQFYSQALGLSSKALTMRISRGTGQSARHLIQERILIEAKRLLGYTESSVKEIGYALGFEDPNYFVRFFREQVGLTPLKFRQGHAQK